VLDIDSPPVQIRQQIPHPSDIKVKCGFLSSEGLQRPSGSAKSVVFIFQPGVPSQHETFDPKPQAPEQVRGEYGTTQTQLPGVLFCEHLLRLAMRANR
jgi:hypothetical protein